MRVFRQSFPYFKKYIGIHLFCVLLGLCRAIILLVEPQIMALIVDKVINPALGSESKDNSSIFLFLIKDIPEDNYVQIFKVLIIIFLVFMLLYFVCFFARWNIAHFFSQRSEIAMRQDAIDKINHYNLNLTNEYTAGELITISSQDPAAVKELYISILPFMFDNVFYITIATYCLCRISMKLMIFPIIIGLAYVSLTFRYTKDMERIYEDRWKKNTALNTLVQESIYGIRTIKSYGREKYFFGKFIKTNEALRQMYYHLADVKARYDVFYSSIQNIIYLICLSFGIYLAIHGTMTSGEFTSFLSYLLSISFNFISFVYLLGDYQNSVVSGKRLFTFLHKEDEVAKKYGNEQVCSTPSIELKHLCVKNEKKVVLDDINLSIPYGKKIGVMGKTGSGKSVLLKTMQSFIEPSGGEFLIDGKPSHAYSKDSIVRNFSYAMQEIFLFSNTITNNIAMYNPDSDKKFIETCANVARVDEFAKHFSEGYETIVGEKGFGLSGGQKQRVSIARALLKNAPILVMDDTTNALDLETEAEVIHNIKEFCPEKTWIITTHRAAAIKDADEIIYIEDGKIAERGTFKELIDLNGRYAAIYHRQTGEEVVMNG